MRVINSMNFPSLEYGKYWLNWSSISDKKVTIAKKVKNTDRRSSRLLDVSG